MFEVRFNRWRDEINPTIKDGWMGDRIWEVVLAVGDFQAAHGVTGDIVEVGVYYGKFLFLLDVLRGEGETTWGVDLFEDHIHNVRQWPQSGVAEHTYYPARVRRDVDTWGQGGIQLLRMDSLALPRDWLKDRVRLFSIDGNLSA